MREVELAANGAGFCLGEGSHRYRVPTTPALRDSSQRCPSPLFPRLRGRSSAVLFKRWICHSGLRFILDDVSLKKKNNYVATIYIHGKKEQFLTILISEIVIHSDHSLKIHFFYDLYFYDCFCSFFLIGFQVNVECTKVIMNLLFSH